VVDIYTSLIGTSGVKAEQIDSYVATRNPDAPRLGEYYVKFGRKFNIRHDIAAGQMVHETNFLLFTGTAQPEWHNPAGLDVIGTPGAGQRFDSWEQGVHAHFERLAGYVYPECPNPDCGKYDKNHGHWRYYWLMENVGSADRLVDIAHLWTVSPPEEYAQKVAYHTNNIINTSVPGIEKNKILLWIAIAAALLGTIYLLKQ